MSDSKNKEIAEEQKDRIIEIIRADLDRRFKGKFVFDPIVVEPAVDEFGGGDGEPYLRIAIVFKGDQNMLDPDWTAGLIPRIRPKLQEESIDEFPSPSFIEESEWNATYA